jgi:hypothetical protein
VKREVSWMPHATVGANKSITKIPLFPDPSFEDKYTSIFTADFKFTFHALNLIAYLINVTSLKREHSND